MEVKAEYLVIFSEEASDQLREWEESLLALEKSPGGKEPLNNMFRAIHTLKGSAGFIGFDSLQKMAHALESSLSSVRDGAREYDSALGDLLFKGLDLARTMIDAFTNDPSPEGRAGADLDVESLLARLADAATASVASSTVAAAVQKAPSTADERDKAPVALKGPALVTSASGRTSSLVVRIEGQNREAYMRSCLVKARLDRLGTVLGMEPSPEVLRESTEPFVYTVTVSADTSAADLAAAISIDQVSAGAAVWYRYSTMNEVLDYITRELSFTEELHFEPVGSSRWRRWPSRRPPLSSSPESCTSRSAPCAATDGKEPARRTAAPRGKRERRPTVLRGGFSRKAT